MKRVTCSCVTALADAESCVFRIISGLRYEIVTNDMSALNHFIMALLKEIRSYSGRSQGMTVFERWKL